MEKREYSCVKKTKKAFERSLAELSKDYQANKISVTMVCKKAQLSRNAFYFHYKDINALIEDIENDVIREAQALLEELDKLGFPKTVYATIDALIDLFESRRDTVLMLMDNTYSTSFISRLSDMYSEFNYKFYVQYNGERDSRTGYEYYYRFISSGFYGLLRRWLENPDDMTKASLKGLAYVLVKRLIVPGNPDIEQYAMPIKN
ncbi:MAG: TetR/AcrR family transcriptional regulator [Acutalibacteraceae bacterium]